MGERPSPDAPHPEKEAPPPDTHTPPPERAEPARKSARCGVGDGSPCPHPPQAQQVGIGPRPHARADERSGVGECLSPNAPHPDKSRPPRAPTSRPHSAQKPALKSARCRVGDGSPRPLPRTNSQWAVGPGRTPECTGGRGWESARPRTPHQQARGATPGHPHTTPQRAKPVRTSARCGIGYGSPVSHPPHPQPVGSGPRPHARTDERSGVGERLTPDAPHPGKRRPPRAPLCRPQSAQSRHAKVRAVGLVTDPHARSPRINSQWVVGPGCTPKRTRGRGRESARPRTPHTQAGGAPPEHCHAAPTACKASWQERALWGW